MRLLHHFGGLLTQLLKLLSRLLTQLGKTLRLMIRVLVQTLRSLLTQFSELLRLLRRLLLQTSQRIRRAIRNLAVHLIHVGGEVLQNLRAAQLLRRSQVAVRLGQITVHDAELANNLGPGNQLVRLVHELLNCGTNRRVKSSLRDGESTGQTQVLQLLG